MKSKYKGKVTRTSGWQSQNEYDNTLATLDVSSLKFLKYKYDKDIKDFGNFNDLHDKDNMIVYQELLQRKKMITEEIENRLMDYDAISETFKEEVYFNPETSLVVSTERGPLYYINFDEDETNYQYNNVTLNEYPDEYPTVSFKHYKSREDIYKDWNYYEDINE